MRKLIGFTALAMVLCACGDDPPMVTTIEVSPPTAELLALIETVQFTATVKDQDDEVMPGVTVEWKSSDIVVVVNQTGLAMARENGEATITASAESVEGTAKVVVRQVAALVSVSPDDTILVVGDTARLVADAIDANGHDIEDAVFEWSSTIEQNVTVDENGLVTAVAVGFSGIEAKLDELWDLSTVSVIEPPPPPAFVWKDDFDDGLEKWDTTGLDGATAEIVDGDLEIMTDDCEQHPVIVADLGEARNGNLRLIVPLWEIESGDEYIQASMAFVLNDDGEAYVLELDFEEWRFRAWYEDGDGGTTMIQNWTFDDDGELIDWGGETEIHFGLYGTTFYASGDEQLFSVDMAGKMPGGTDPERSARYIGLGLSRSCVGDHGLGIDRVEFHAEKDN